MCGFTVVWFGTVHMLQLSSASTVFWINKKILLFVGSWVLLPMFKEISSLCNPGVCNGECLLVVLQADCLLKKTHTWRRNKKHSATQGTTQIPTATEACRFENLLQFAIAT